MVVKKKRKKEKKIGYTACLIRKNKVSVKSFLRLDFFLNLYIIHLW